MTPAPDCGENTYRGSGRLTGKTAVITGADSGIGRAVAIAYAREGADVLISYLNEHEDAAEVAELVRPRADGLSRSPATFQIRRTVVPSSPRRSRNSGASTSWCPTLLSR